MQAIRSLLDERIRDNPYHPCAVLDLSICHYCSSPRQCMQSPDLDKRIRDNPCYQCHPCTVLDLSITVSSTLDVLNAVSIMNIDKVGIFYLFEREVAEVLGHVRAMVTPEKNPHAETL
jgi:hypothetical protein